MRTLRIMADVYSKGLQKEVQVEVQTLEKMFPVLEELLELHTHFLSHLLERRREAREEQRGNDGGFVIRRIGDVLLDQVSSFSTTPMSATFTPFIIVWKCSPVEFYPNHSIIILTNILQNNLNFKCTLFYCNG